MPRLLVLLVCLLLTAGCADKRWSAVEQEVLRWESELTREPDQAEVYGFWADGNWYGVSTAELQARHGSTYVGNGVPSFLYDGAPVQKDGFFVVPMEVWVDLIPEAIAACRAYASTR